MKHIHVKDYIRQYAPAIQVGMLVRANISRDVQLARRAIVLGDTFGNYFSVQIVREYKVNGLHGPRRCDGGVDTPPGTVKAIDLVLADYLYAEVVSKCVAKHDCPTSKLHVTGYVCADQHADLYGGSVLPDIVFDVNMLHLLVQPSIARRLAESSLRGVESVHLPIGVNQSECKDPTLFRVVFNGRPVRRRTMLLNTTQNVCPFCHQGPIWCPECYDIQCDCPHCGERAV